jgi:hypothetical protein
VRAEQVHTRIDVGNINEAPGTNLVVSECRFVAAYGPVIVDTRCQVAEVSRWKCRTGKWLKISHVEDVGGPLN